MPTRHDTPPSRIPTRSSTQASRAPPSIACALPATRAAASVRRVLLAPTSQQPGRRYPKIQFVLHTNMALATHTAAERGSAEHRGSLPSVPSDEMSLTRAFFANPPSSRSPSSYPPSPAPRAGHAMRASTDRIVQTRTGSALLRAFARLVLLVCCVLAAGWQRLAGTSSIPASLPFVFSLARRTLTPDTLLSMLPCCLFQPPTTLSLLLPRLSISPFPF